MTVKKRNIIIFVFGLIALLAINGILIWNSWNKYGKPIAEQAMADSLALRSPLRQRILPLISEAYEKNEWEQITLLADTLINNGEIYDDIVIAYTEALCATGKADKAITILLEDLDNSKSHNKKYYIYNELGDAYRVQGSLHEALSAYNLSVSQNPEYSRPIMNAAEVYALLGDTVEAKSQYMKAVALFEEHQFAEGMIKAGQGLINIAPDDYASWLVLGRGADYAEDYELEKQCILKSISLLKDEEGYVNGERNMKIYKESLLQLIAVNYYLDDYEACQSLLQNIKDRGVEFQDYEEEINKMTEIINKAMQE